MKIEIINTGQTITEMSKTGKPYKVFELIYKNHDFDSKVETKKINEYSKVAFNALGTSKQGSFYDVAREKDAAGYWQWTAVTAIDSVMNSPASPAETVVPAAGRKVVGSTYETAEERAANRSKIVRQSSIGYAIQTLKTDKSPANTDDVLKVAQIYLDWVNQTKTPVQEIIDMEDDIPQ
jgi:hypothetical protein